MNPKTFHRFNSGRGYTAQGQIILYTAQLVETDELVGDVYRVVFIDISRNVSGVIECFGNDPDEIMNGYDAGGYQYPSNTEEDEIRAHFLGEDK